MIIEQRLTPNHAPRQDDIRFVILHCTETATDEHALDVYLDRKRELSCHYYITYDGKIMQLVLDENTAWHAGISAWQEQKNLNHASLGIEIGNPGEDKNTPFTEQQYQALEYLLGMLIAKHNVSPSNILAHSDIATNRKKDPGRHFDWRRLEAKKMAGTFTWPKGALDPLDALYKWGYHGDEADVIRAFQRRYVPDDVTGTLSKKTHAFICAAK